MEFIAVSSFEDWRTRARRLLAAGLSPSDAIFREDSEQQSLFDPPPLANNRDEESTSPISRVPRQYLEAARIVSCHRDADRYQLLYRLLWRLCHGEPRVLEWEADDDVRRFQWMRKAVDRDVHKMHAFVRFRQVISPDGEQFVAWHRPDHRIVPLAAPFFARRFPEMHWAILTPDESVSWDRQQLQFGPGVGKGEAPAADDLEDLWLTYYGAIFNPARIKLKAMKKEMPVRHWATLPEAGLIPQLLAEAPQRVQQMIDRQEGFARTAADFFPAGKSWNDLRQAAMNCQACDLCQHATQTVFGAGPLTAKLVLVGEQPGDVEDQQGRPFVGPAGEVLDRALEEAGVVRAEVYLTNTVKHFKFEQQGTRRLHKRPDAREIAACRPWVEAEIAMIAPQVVVCLGATAAQTLIRREFRMQTQRGKVLSTVACQATLATWHPSAVLRATDEGHRQELLTQLVADLRQAKDLAGYRSVKEP